MSNERMAKYRGQVLAMAEAFIVDQLGTAEAKEAAGKVALAYRQAAQSNPKIYDCTPQSVANCIAQSAMTGLAPGGPYPSVYLIPRGNQLTWMLSFRGAMALASRAGTELRARAVYDGDFIDIREGFEPNVEHRPNLDVDQEWENLRGVYVVARRSNGTRDFIWLNRKAIEKRRANSDSWRRNSQRSVWGQWPIEMALKTAVKYAVSRGLANLDDAGRRAVARDTETEIPDGDLQVVPVPENGAPQISGPTNGAGMAGLGQRLGVPSPIAIADLKVLDSAAALSTLKTCGSRDLGRIYKAASGGDSASRSWDNDMRIERILALTHSEVVVVEAPPAEVVTTPEVVNPPNPDDDGQGGTGYGAFDDMP